MTYRTEDPLVVLVYKNNHEAAVTVPAGKLIEIVGPADDDRFLIGRVDREEFLAFETDIAVSPEAH